jgi:hypothetical protein
MRKYTSVSFKSFLFGIIAAGCCMAATANAQIGTGWTNYFDTHFIDYTVNGDHRSHDDSSFSDAGVVYTNSNGVRTFKLVNNTSNRLEVRSDEHYTSGKRQMQGDLMIHNISEQSVHQIFHGSSGPFMMVKGYNGSGGSLKKQSGSVTLVTGIANVYVRYNCLHQVGSYLKLYINGSQKFSGGGAAQDGSGNNNKYGLYGTKVTSDPTVYWKGIKFFK